MMATRIRATRRTRINTVAITYSAYRSGVGKEGSLVNFYRITHDM